MKEQAHWHECIRSALGAAVAWLRTTAETRGEPRRRRPCRWWRYTVAVAQREAKKATFAVAHLQAQASDQALAALASVVDTHRGMRPWLAATVEQMARRIAMRLVLERLPDDLGEIAAEFENVAGQAR